MLSVFSITMKRNLTTSCLQRNKRMSPFEGIKEWLCKSFACYSLLPEALLKSVFQITVSESRLASSEGNSKRQLRKKWGIYTSRAVPLRQFHGMRRGISDANKTAFWFQKPHFSSRTLCKGGLCLILFLGYFMPCPCICESHEAKKTFDSNKLERLKS